MSLLVKEQPTVRRSQLHRAFETELGWMALAVNDQTLCAAVFGYKSQQAALRALVRNLKAMHGQENFGDREMWTSAAEMAGDVSDSLANDLEQRLTAYAVGEPVDFGDVDVATDHLTSFGARVIAACRRIRWGRTRSYGQLAAECGSPGAARAVGQVMAGNRCPLVVPCHRVLGAGGRLGGFSAPGGLTTKRRLLALEGRL